MVNWGFRIEICGADFGREGGSDLVDGEGTDARVVEKDW